MKKSIKICFTALKGMPCYRPVCKYAHPYVENPLGVSSDMGFRQTNQKKPPLDISVEEMMSVASFPINDYPVLSPRVSVIVRNQVTTADTVRDLAQNLKVVKIH